MAESTKPITYYRSFLLLRYLGRVEKLEEGIGRLLDLDGSRLALFPLRLLHHPHGDVLAWLPADVGADGFGEALVVVVGVHQIGLREHL